MPVIRDKTTDDIIAERDALLAAVKHVREIIKDGAMTGFNCHDGDWADRLFASQALTFEAVQKAEAASGAGQKAVLLAHGDIGPDLV